MTYLPSTPDTELRYPLARQGELVVTYHSNYSHKHGLLIVGLTDHEAENLAQVIVNAQAIDPSAIISWLQHIAGGVNERTQAQSIAQGQQCRPLTELSTMASTGTDTDDDDRPQPQRQSRTGSIKITRKRITEDELSTAIMILTGFSSIIDGKSRKEILALTAMDIRLWPKATGHMIEKGLWIGKGERRDRRYYWNGG